MVEWAGVVEEVGVVVEVVVVMMTMMKIMVCLNIRIGGGSDCKTLQSNPFKQTILPGSQQAKWTMTVSIAMLCCFLVRIRHSVAWMGMFNFLLLSHYFLQTYWICIRQGMKTVGYSGKISGRTTTTFPLPPCNATCNHLLSEEVLFSASADK